MRKSLFVLLIIFFITTSFCGKKDENKIKEEFKNGIKIIHNPALPLKGEVILKLKEVFKIDASDVDAQDPPEFGEFRKDKDNNIYINDYRNRRILKFNKAGEFQISFGGKGEGPGEFQYIRSFKKIGDKLIVWGRRKFSTFNISGKFLNEKRVKKFYYNVLITGEDKFIVNFYKMEGDGKVPERFKVNALIDEEENILATFFKAKNVGSTMVKKKKFVFSFSSTSITEDIKNAYNDKKRVMYGNLSNQYKIYIKNLEGETQKIIERKFEKIKIKDSDKDKIVKAFNNINDWQKKTIKENLPENFCVISSIKVLPGDYILAYVIKGAGDIEMDLFDDRGRFLYILKYPENFDLYYTEFMEKKLIGIREESESDRYIEFEILNYDEIFTLK